MPNEFGNLVYRKYAEAANVLEQQIRDAGWDDGFTYVRAPIGLDGAVSERLIEYIQNYRNFMFHDKIPTNPSLKSTFQASSKTGEIDREKLYRILSVASDCQAPACFIDLRTKTGSLGRFLDSEIARWECENQKEVESYYAVLFDPHRKADIRGSEKELFDQERLMWVDGKDKVNQLIDRRGDSYAYNLDARTIDNFNHIDGIKLEILRILND